MAVWGSDFSSDLTDEDAPPRPCGVPYIDTKGASELLARRRGATVVRPGDVYGPGSTPWAVRPLEMLRARRFALPDGGAGLMTPVYVDDLVDCVMRALVRPEAAGTAFTAWDGHAVPATEFFGPYARMLGRERVPTLPRRGLGALAGVPELAGRVTRRAPDVTRNAVVFVSRRATYPNARARELLGWEPQVDLAEGMRRTERWFRAEGLLR